MLKNPGAKGKRFEYYCRDLLSGYGFPTRRTPLSGGIDGWKGDITSPGFPFFIECKNTKKTTFAQWYKKAQDQSGALPPIILWNYQGQAFAFLLFTDLLNIMVDKPVAHLKISKPVKKEKNDLTVGLLFSKESMAHRKPKKTYGKYRA